MASDHLWMWVETELKRFRLMCRLLTACAALTFLTNSACADGLGDAKAGLEALNRGDNTAAISLFTKAITGGTLSRSDKELAYVKRSEAYLAMGAKDKALADATKALSLDAGDSEAAAVRDKTQRVAGNGPSLEVTANFIKESITDTGLMRFIVTKHFTGPAKQNPAQYGAACQLSLWNLVFLGIRPLYSMTMGT
jgi:tetratricopeptide (TPR) repeat protein